MYSYTTQVGYSDCGADGVLKIPALVNYLQNCSMFHSTAIGFDLKHYEDMKKAWLLSSWQIEIGRLPKHADRIRVCTQPYEFKGFYGYRNFWVEDEAGEILVKANSIWFFMDMEKGMPVKTPIEEIEGYGTGEKLDMAYEDRRIRLPKDVAFESLGEPIRVKESFLDTNRHVNNGQYVKTAYELLQEHGKEMGLPGREVENAGFYPKISQIRVEYSKAAKYGNTMYSLLHREENMVYLRLADEGGEPYVTVSFRCD